MTEATSSNYFAIALEDEHQGDSRSSTKQTTKAEERSTRIAQAVERSKLEYKAEHVYTERGWMHDHSSRDEHSEQHKKPKIDKQQLEYLTTSLYYSSPPQHSQALRLILNAFDEKVKNLGGLSRELIDTGMKCALISGDLENGLKFADSSESCWRNPFGGLTENAAKIYLESKDHQRALRPLILYLSSGLFYPLIHLLLQTLQHYLSTTILSSLIELLEWHSERLKPSPSLFSPNPSKSHLPSKEPVHIDVQTLAEELKLDLNLHEPLRQLVQRLQKSGSGEEPKEKSVRDL